MTGLIDYGMGNLLSVSKALESLGADVLISSQPEQLDSCNSLVLPGVGNFGDGVKHLREKGLADFISGYIDSGRPFLGICLGMQLLMEDSEEAPGVPGLGIFRGSVVRFPESGLKVPHMGWNNVAVTQSGASFFSGIPDNSYFYFVHSYFVRPEDDSIIAGRTDYGADFAAALSSENIFATQFHPEKSQDCGLSLLRNFLDSE